MGKTIHFPNGRRNFGVFYEVINGRKYYQAVEISPFYGIGCTNGVLVIDGYPSMSEARLLVRELQVEYNDEVNAHSCIGGL